MLPLLAAILPSVVGIVGSLVRGKNKTVDKVLDTVEAISGNKINSLDDVEEFLKTATPDQILALKKVDSKAKIEYNKNIVELAQAEAKDKQHTREKFSDSKFPQILSLVFIGLIIFTITLLVFFPPVSSIVLSILEQMVGAQTLALGGLLGYWFGSSLGSRNKDLAR